MRAHLPGHRDAIEGRWEHGDVPAAGARGAGDDEAIRASVASRTRDRQTGTVRPVRRPLAGQLFQGHAKRRPRRVRLEIEDTQVEIQGADGALFLLGIDGG